MEGGLVSSAKKMKRARRRAAAAMWSAIGVAIAMGALLLWRGWGARAVAVAAGVLLLSCLVVCVWAGLIEERATRRLAESARELARARAESERGFEDRRGDRARSEQPA